MTILKETLFEKIKITENIQVTLEKNKVWLNYLTKTSIETIVNIPYDIIGKDITSISNYDLRNRKTEAANPFFVTKSKKF